ncbi:transcriptional repressor [Lampropedia puyangensis]|uniref:Transcriptional repressor n=1 Tax=Lampropedia puyangensis TaxID=1330072 RepID=A0A4S8FCH2_9BURK|nr:Fur family transcriptional regulator [Lampropedia puyangensis]THU05067.1 transcriptional repressor [Lampropedia puyangensis]
MSTTTHPPHAQEANMHLLRQAGISITLPRLELLRVLQEAGKALTAHQIYRCHLDAGHDVPLSTIYVNLKRLEDTGIIHRIRLDNDSKSLYCVSTDASPVRLVCKQCGQLLWVNDPRIALLLEQVCQDKGYALQGYGVTLEANCQTCAPGHLPS